MQIRRAEPGEGRLLAEEFWFPLAVEMERYSTLNEVTADAAETAVEGFEDLLGRDDRFIFLLEVDGTEVAFVSVEIGERPTRVRGRYASITDLYVTEAFRGRGCATALVERVEALAAAENCDYLRVSAEWRNEAARALYEGQGYEEKQVTYAKPLTIEEGVE